jgi:hypothetical protein
MQRFVSAASQNRDRTKRGVRYGPGSAAHHAAKSGALRCVRGTQKLGCHARLKHPETRAPEKLRLWAALLSALPAENRRV